ncbi:unnamed protein product, partial [Mesorhabditis belari]|uniref:Cadherin domain-containing protein n=1 Tax=Mesorhabditis belari TaxID=2138241 RepID=A0AAF3EQ68_9BILA
MQSYDAKKENADGSRWESFSLVLSGPQKSRANLEIQVVDVNDNAPEFLSVPSTISVFEDTPEGSAILKLRTRDPDTGIAGMAVYSIDNANFSVDKRKCGNGECWTTLRVKEKLDFEKQRKHLITVTAKDGDPTKNSSLETSVSITIHVLDAQDQPPLFVTDLSQTFLIQETSKIGDIVFEIRARDGDEAAEAANSIRYSLQENQYLEIDERTGNVKLKSEPGEELDLRLGITATEEGEGQMKSEGELKIKFVKARIIEKTLSSHPILPKAESSRKLCEKELYEMRIREGSENFDLPETIHLTGKQDKSSLRLIGGADIFAFKQTADDQVEIVVNNVEKMDYEKTTNYSLKLTSPMGSCEIEIFVLDVNDNAPKFKSDSYTFYVMENEEAMELGKITAIDADSTESSKIDYQVVGTSRNVFKIDDEGRLMTTRAVDREKDTQFTFAVRATDKGGKFTDVPVKVVVKDVNDNTPRFESDHITIDVVEEVASKHKISARDEDHGENAMLTYTLSNMPEGLPIDVNNGILFIGRIDRDSLTVHPIELVLTATDSGKPPLSGKTNITIRVEDTNDNRPQFTLSHYAFSVEKNLKPGQSVGKVEASDDDATAPNNRIYFTTEDDRFYIDVNGSVVYNGTEPFTKDQWIDFKVWAHDNGDPSLNSSTTVTINEHKNTLGGAITTKLNRTTDEKTEVRWANAKMPGYSYEILRATADGISENEVRKWVSIDRKTGVIHTLKKLDVDTVKAIKLAISMKKKKKEIPVELIIKIVDENDNSPFFKRAAYKANVTEDVAVGTPILQIKAEGTDAENLLRYFLVLNSSAGTPLEIDQYGTIRTKEILDFEKLQKIDGIVTVKDSLGHNASTNLTVFVTDVNDNRPEFKNGSVFTVYASESLPIGASLSLEYPLATDRDSGRFGKIVYSIIGGENHFAINEKTSVITLKKELDYEIQRSHSLTIRATDNGGKKPYNEVFASITVYVEDSNDHSPIIHNADLTHLSVGEDAKIGDVVAIISASDADGGGSQPVLITTNHTQFRVDETGKLVVAIQLSGYAGENICGHLTASDAGQPPRNTTTPFCVSVQGRRQGFLPLIVYPKPNSIHYFDENEHYDELLRLKMAKQEGEKEEYSYKFDQSFKKDWEFFEISPNGALTSKAPFDFEKKAIHELRVSACNDKRNCTSITLFISVNDKNDNCPIFQETSFQLTIVENERGPVPRKVGRIPSAIDSDYHADNKKICYSVDNPAFFFHPLTDPFLYTNRSFDREQQDSFKLTITAYDCSLVCVDPLRPVNATLRGTIRIEDMNDNFPKFAERIFYKTVIQGQNGPGSQIAKIEAIDPDEEKDGLRYSIKGVVRSEKQTFGIGESPIHVDERTGELTAIDLLREPSYTFTLAVIDSAGHEDTVTVVVSLIGYDQQTELIFDAPFDYIRRNEKNLIRLLSSATALTAVIDRCRQNSNSTVVLAHFLDQNGKFVDVNQAIHTLMKSSSSARSELKNAYGLREASASVLPRPRTVEVLIIAAAFLLVLVLFVLLLIWCRQRNEYARKLRQISAQAKHLASPSGHSTPPKKSAYFPGEPILVPPGMGVPVGDVYPPLNPLNNNNFSRHPTISQRSFADPRASMLINSIGVTDVRTLGTASSLMRCASHPTTTPTTTPSSPSGHPSNASNQSSPTTTTSIH